MRFQISRPKETRYPHTNEFMTHRLTTFGTYNIRSTFRSIRETRPHDCPHFRIHSPTSSWCSALCFALLLEGLQDPLHVYALGTSAMCADLMRFSEVLCNCWTLHILVHFRETLRPGPFTKSFPSCERFLSHITCFVLGLDETLSDCIVEKESISLQPVLACSLLSILLHAILKLFVNFRS